MPSMYSSCVLPKKTKKLSKNLVVSEKFRKFVAEKETSISSTRKK